MEPALQENPRGIILVPLQTIREPSAVRRPTPSEESDLGPRNMETVAPESTKNSWLERISCRNRREKLHSSGSGSGPGFNSEKPAGWKGSSTCWTANQIRTGFPTVLSFIFVLLVVPTWSRRRWRTGGRSWSWRTSGRSSRTGSGSYSISLNTFGLSS